jgi:tRNA(Ile)-lysidine synthase
MSAQTSMLARLQKIAPVDAGHRFIVAISGGVDSVVLAFLCKEAGFNIALAHCNFQLRGAESDRDEALVRKLATTWQVPVSVNKVDLKTYAAQKKLSTQEAAREFRYDWFATLASASTSPCWILTAHQADDNAETVAMHFFRGTGLSGLTGIPPRNGAVLRPLLDLRRSEILQIAQDKELPFAEDSTNAQETYTRNFFRHTVLPAVEKVYPAVKENLFHSIERFTAIEALYRECVDRLRRTLLIKRGEDYRVSVRALRRYSGQALLYELFTPFGFSSGQLGEIEKLLKAKTGAQLSSATGTTRLYRNRNFLLLTTRTTPSASTGATLYVESSPCSVSVGRGTIQLSDFAVHHDPPPSSPYIAWIDASEVVFPLLIRRWRTGDYFYPLGMRKKKKLSRFFIDQKLSPADKEDVWVIESQERICWVVGMRIDDRFKITPKTRQALAIHFMPADQN